MGCVCACEISIRWCFCGNKMFWFEMHAIFLFCFIIDVKIKCRRCPSWHTTTSVFHRLAAPMTNFIPNTHAFIRKMNIINDDILNTNKMNENTHTHKKTLQQNKMFENNNAHRTHTYTKTQDLESDSDDLNCLKSLFGEIFGK